MRSSLRRLSLLVLVGIGAASAPVAAVPVRAPTAAGEPLADCPVEAFPAVGPGPANRAYPEPRLEVSCSERQLVIESNGIPPYEFQQRTPADLRPQEYVWRIPLQPEIADETTAVPLLGPVAVAVNGLPIYGPNEGPFPDPFGDPVANDILDWCLGHTARRGDYHYHALLVACLTAGHDPAGPSPVIAFAFDGFPIYGPNGCADAQCSEVVRFRSGWVQTGDPRTDAWDKHEFVADDDPLTLDRCNGHVGADGDYHYHATETFPYVLGCYRGYVDPSATQRPGRLRGPRRD